PAILQVDLELRAAGSRWFDLHCRIQGDGFKCRHVGQGLAFENLAEESGHPVALLELGEIDRLQTYDPMHQMHPAGRSVKAALGIHYGPIAPIKGKERSQFASARHIPELDLAVQTSRRQGAPIRA